MKPAHIALLVLAAWSGGQLYGSKLATSAAKLRVAEQLQTASEAARQRERSLNHSLLTQAEQLAQQKAKENEKKHAMHTAIDSGALRLSINTAGPGTCQNTAAPGQPGAVARAELLPADAAALIDIAIDADSVVRQLTAVQAAYDAARTACGG